MDVPPTLPQLPVAATGWESCRLQWAAAHSLPTAPRLQQRFRLLRPWVQEAVRHLSVRFSYLVDEPSLALHATASLDARPELPRNETIARAHLRSLLLRAIQDEAHAPTCDLRDPMAPWHAFRARVNSQPLRVRRYFLAFLPTTERAGDFHRTAPEPRKYWFRVWNRLTEGTPKGCLPDSWLERANKQGKRSAGLLVPGQSHSQQFEAYLTQSAVFLESQRPGATGLAVPSRLQVASPDVIGKRLRFILEREGGLPQTDDSLREALEGILEWSHGKEADLEPMSLLRTAQERHPDSFDLSTLMATYKMRRQRLDAAESQYRMALSLAKDAKEISAILGNLAGLAALRQDLPQALHLAQEGISYFQDCAVSGNNYAVILAWIRGGILGELPNA